MNYGKKRSSDSEDFYQKFFKTLPSLFGNWKVRVQDLLTLKTFCALPMFHHLFLVFGDFDKLRWIPVELYSQSNDKSTSFMIFR